MQTPPSGSKRKRSNKSSSSSSDSKTIQKIAKRASTLAVKKILRSAETKLGYFGYNSGVNAKQFLTYNLMYQAGFGNGTGGENSTFIGDKISLSGVRMRGLVRTSTTLGNVTAHLHIYLVSTPKYVTSTNLAAGDLQATADILQFPPRLDTDKVTVLAKKKIRIQPIISGAIATQEFDFYHNFKGRIANFMQDGTIGTYALKDVNYYLCFYPEVWGSTPGTTNAVTVSGATDIFYKDM